MNPTVIFCDASADIDLAYAKAHDIQCVPMNCVSGGQAVTLTGNETPDDIRRFYDGMRHGSMMTTSQITPNEYVQAFSPFMEKGQHVIYLSLSSGLTNTYNSALSAKEKLAKKFPDVQFWPVDTLSATGGIDILLERAVSNRDAGMSPEENARDLMDLSHRVCHVFLVSDLMHLCRGGRVSATSAVFGTALQIKPILIIDEQGKLTVVDKKRGAKSALKELQTRFAKARDPKEHRVYLANSDSRELLDALIPLVRETDAQADIEAPLLSPVIGAHTGPGMIAVIFIGDRSAIQ